jgi:hypothetical protein
MDASSGTMYVWCIVVLDSKFYILEISQHTPRLTVACDGHPVATIVFTLGYLVRSIGIIGVCSEEMIESECRLGHGIVTVVEKRCEHGSSVGIGAFMERYDADACVVENVLMH